MDGVERHRIVADAPEFRSLILLTNFGPRERYKLVFNDGTEVIGIPFIAPKVLSDRSQAPPRNSFSVGNQRDRSIDP